MRYGYSQGFYCVNVLPKGMVKMKKKLFEAVVISVWIADQEKTGGIELRGFSFHGHVRTFFSSSLIPG
jgi:hypothetical protein